MENQYNYYNPEGANGNYQYGGPQMNQQYEPPRKEKKSNRKVPKAVAVTGFALLFGVVSSATFLTSNIIGSRILGLDESTGSSETARTVNNSTALSTSTSELCRRSFRSQI